MPTPPIDAATVAHLKETNQGGYLAMLKQWVDDPQFFCCISGNTVGVDKDPVPVLTIADRVVCIGVAVTVDFSLSWSPTDTLAGTPYTITWGDGSPDTNGNFPNPRNPAAETATKAAGYATAGWYTITIEVVDTLGATGITMLQIYARDCTQPANPLPFPESPSASFSHTPWVTWGQIVPSDTQVWYTLDVSVANPVWTRVNDWASLSCTEIHSVMLELESDDNEYMYVADFSGIWMHPMPPTAGNWTLMQTATAIVAAAGVATSTHTEMLQRLAIDINNDGHQWVTWNAERTAPFAVDSYCGVAWTTDGWSSIAGSVIVATVVRDPLKTQDLNIWGIDVDQADPNKIYCAVSYMDDFAVDDECRLYRSLNGGTTWSQIDTISAWYKWADVWVPYNGSGSYVYWGNGDRIKRSTGGGFSTVYNPALANTYANVLLCGPIDDTDVCTMLLDYQLYEYRGGATTHITPDLAGAGDGYGLICMTRNSSNYATSILWAGGAASAAIQVKENTGGIQNNKDVGYVDTYPYFVAWPELREYST